MKLDLPPAFLEKLATMNEGQRELFSLILDHANEKQLHFMKLANDLSAVSGVIDDFADELAKAWLDRKK